MDEHVDHVSLLRVLAEEVLRLDPEKFINEKRKWETNIERARKKMSFEITLQAVEVTFLLLAVCVWLTLVGGPASDGQTEIDTSCLTSTQCVAYIQMQNPLTTASTTVDISKYDFDKRVYQSEYLVYYCLCIFSALACIAWTNYIRQRSVASLNYMLHHDLSAERRVTTPDESMMMPIKPSRRSQHQLEDQELDEDRDGMARKLEEEGVAAENSGGGGKSAGAMSTQVLSAPFHSVSNVRMRSSQSVSPGGPALGVNSSANSGFHSESGTLMSSRSGDGDLNGGNVDAQLVAMNKIIDETMARRRKMLKNAQVFQVLLVNFPWTTVNVLRAIEYGDNVLSTLAICGAAFSMGVRTALTLFPALKQFGEVLDNKEHDRGSTLYQKVIADVVIATGASTKALKMKPVFEDNDDHNSSSTADTEKALKKKKTLVTRQAVLEALNQMEQTLEGENNSRDECRPISMMIVSMTSNHEIEAGLKEVEDWFERREIVRNAALAAGPSGAANIFKAGKATTNGKVTTVSSSSTSKSLTQSAGPSQSMSTSALSRINEDAFASVPIVGITTCNGLMRDGHATSTGTAVGTWALSDPEGWYEAGYIDLDEIMKISVSETKSDEDTNRTDQKNRNIVRKICSAVLEAKERIAEKIKASYPEHSEAILAKRAQQGQNRGSKHSPSVGVPGLWASASGGMAVVKDKITGKITNKPQGEQFAVLEQMDAEVNHPKMDDLAEMILLDEIEPSFCIILPSPGGEDVIVNGFQKALGTKVVLAGGSSADNTIEGNWRQWVKRGKIPEASLTTSTQIKKDGVSADSQHTADQGQHHAGQGQHSAEDNAFHNYVLPNSPLAEGRHCKTDESSDEGVDDHEVGKQKQKSARLQPIVKPSIDEDEFEIGKQNSKSVDFVAKPNEDEEHSDASGDEDSSSEEEPSPRNTEDERRFRVRGNQCVFILGYCTGVVDCSLYTGYESSGKEGIVTKTNGSRCIEEIDNRPALQVYQQWSANEFDPCIKEARGKGETTANILGPSSSCPLGQICGRDRFGDPVFRTIHPHLLILENQIANGVVAQSKGCLTCFSDVKEGDTLLLMRGTRDVLISRLSRLIQQTREKRALTTSEIAGSFVIFCAGCMMYCADAGMKKSSSRLQQALGMRTYLGLHTFGEQGTFPDGSFRHGNLMFSALIFSNRRALLRLVDVETGEVHHTKSKVTALEVLQRGETIF